MLERTVGCLESGSLRRLLPGTQYPLKSCRTLHSAFWKHGGGDLELSPFWAALLRGPDPLESYLEKYSDQNDSSPSGLLFLDFLYPTGTINLLRQFSSWGLDRKEARGARLGLGRLGQRLYTSSANDATNPIADKKMETDLNSSSLETSSKDAQAADFLNTDVTEALRKLLGVERAYDYEEAWRRYQLLDRPGRRQLQVMLIDFFSTSKRVVDAERVTMIFGELDDEQRNSATFRAAVRSNLILRNPSAAIELYERAVAQVNEPVGAADILAYFVENSLWSKSFDFWTDFLQRGRHDGSAYDIWAVATNSDQLATQALKFANHVNARINSHLSGRATEPLSETEAPGTVEPSNTSEQRNNLEGQEEDLHFSESELALQHSQNAASVGVPKSLFPLAEFAAAVIRTALSSERLEPLTLHALLKTLRDWSLDMTTPWLYNQSIQRLVQMRQRRLAVDWYRYARQQTGLDLGQPVLHHILKIFCDYHDVEGMQEVLDDFLRLYKRPTRAAYRMCMVEFARQGDAMTVHALFNQFAERFRKSGNNSISPEDMIPLMHVHAKRGELAEVVATFNQIRDEYQRQPPLMCWNILINAYGKVHDIDNAFDCFEEVLASEDLRPNDYTFGTIMGICASRGDLEQVLMLYRLADELKVEKTAAMVDCLVLAYLQSDRMAEAEKVCDDAIRRKYKGSPTRMWNSMLLSYGMHRDLKNVHRILRKMSELKVEHDEFTYSALMQSLCVVRQPDRAYAILRDVMPDAGVQATNVHYAVVMGGFLAVGRLDMVVNVYDRMMWSGTRKSASIDHLALKSATTGLLQFKATSREYRIHWGGTDETPLKRATNIFLEVVNSMDQQDIAATPRKGAGRVPLDIAYPTMFYSYVMYVLGQNNEFSTVYDLYGRYKTSLPSNKRSRVPIKILTAMMATKSREHDIKSVQEIWDLAVSQAKDQGRPLSGREASTKGTGSKSDDGNVCRSFPMILHSHQLDLTTAIEIYMNALSSAGKIDVISRTIDKLMNDGFVLDRKNWNDYVQHLARNYRWKQAFEVCEAKLIDNWTGWARLSWRQPTRNRVSAEARRASKHPRMVRAIYTTLLYLAKAYLEIQGAAAESRASQMLLTDIEHLCPRTLGAISTMQKTGDPTEQEVLGRY